MPTPIRRRKSSSRLDYRAAVLATPGLVGYWRLGEATGTAARDETGVNGGTYVNSPGLGATGLLTGDSDKAATFDGATGMQVTVGSTGFPTGSSPRTIVAWGNVTLSASQRHIFSYGSPILLFYVTTGRRLVVYNGSTTAQPGDWDDVTDGVVHMMVGVYNGAGWAFTIDGAPLSSRVSQTLTNDASSAVIGRWNADATGWKGTLDEVAIWNRELPQLTIANFYRIGRNVA